MVRKFISAIENGEQTAAQVVAECLRRIAAIDPEVHAWAAVAHLPPPHLDGPLFGLPFGAKDIFEARGLPLSYGSPLYSDQISTKNAALVRELLGAGATLLGKTHTTAFASFDPAPTRNPRFPGHTPGGSSAGSAAAVAAGMVPFAIGTQTLGSVLRPASYCGICGFKPSFGLIPFEGALHFAPSLDTVGFFTETVDDMKVLWERAFDARCDAEISRLLCLRVSAEEPMERALQHAVGQLRAAGVSVDMADPPEGWNALLDAAHTVNAYEGARSHEQRYRDFGERLGTRLAELIRHGLAIPDEAYQSAREHIAHMRGVISSIFWEYPAILTPAATGPAPAGLHSTGDPSPNARWTALGVPRGVPPSPREAVPLGLQITAAWGRDEALISVAAQIEKLLHAATI